MAVQVPDRLTPVPLEEGLTALANGYYEVLGAGPSAPALAALGAQLSLESGNFTKAHCFNWGNKKMPADWDGLFCKFRCDEIFDDATMAHARALGPCQVGLWKGGPKWRVVLIPPHPWSSFCAFQSADEGAADYLKLLALSSRYMGAWHQALAGNPQAFAEALGAEDYYTADVAAYAKGLVSIFGHILPTCTNIANGDPHGVDEALRQLVEEQVKQTLYEAYDSLSNPDELPPENA